MALKDDLYDVMKGMRDDPDNANDDDFADDIDAIIKDFAEGCTLTVAPSTLVGADTAPAGTFSGAASVSWKFAGGKVAAAIKDAASKGADMKDDDLAKAFAKGLDDDKPQWTASLSGNTTLPNGGSSPSTDSGTVTSTFVSATVESALKAAFATMKNMINEGDDGDDVFATALATAVTTYYTASINQGMGASHLAAVQFAVTVAAGA